MTNPESVRDQRKLEHAQFIALYRRTCPEIIEPPAGGARDESFESRIRNLYRDANDSAYIRRMADVRLKTLFKRLEDLLARSPGEGVLIDDHGTEPQRILARRSRELHFLYRYAETVMYEGCELKVPIPAKMRKARLRFAHRCRTLEARLEALGEDVYLVEALGQHSLEEYKALSGRLLSMANLLEEIEPRYPYDVDRLHESTTAKYIIDRLAYTCFRIYEGCDAQIILQLLQVPWLRDYWDHAPEDLNSMIADVALRKTSAYDDRISERPWAIEPNAPFWEPFISR